MSGLLRGTPAVPDSKVSNNAARPSLLMVALCLAAIYIVWGTTYLAIRIGLQELRPFYMLGTRLVVAGGGFLLVLLMLGTPLPTRKQWLNADVPRHAHARDRHRLRQRCRAVGELRRRRRAHQHQPALYGAVAGRVRPQADDARMDRDHHRRHRHRRDGDGAGLPGEPLRHGHHPGRCRLLDPRHEPRKQARHAPRRHGFRGGNADGGNRRADRQRRIGRALEPAQHHARCGAHGLISWCSARSSRSRRIDTSWTASPRRSQRPTPTRTRPSPSSSAGRIGEEHFSANTFIGLPIVLIAVALHAWAWRLSTNSVRTQTPLQPATRTE